MLIKIGKTLRSLYIPLSSVMRGYSMSSILYINRDDSILKIELDIIKLNNRITDELNVLNKISKIKFGTILDNLTSDQFVQVLFSNEFSLYRNIYSQTLGKYVSAFEIFSVSYYYLRSNVVQFQNNTIAPILSRVYNDNILDVYNKLEEKYQRLDTTSVVNPADICIKSNTYIYNKSLIQFRNVYPDVSFLTQFTDSRNGTTEFDEESLYVFSNFDEYGNRWIKLENTYSQKDTKVYYQKYYDEKDYRKEIFGNRNYHITGRVARRINDSFIIVIDSWLQRIKIMKYDLNTNTWYEDVEKSDKFTSNYLGKVIYDSDFVYLSHTFDDFGVIVMGEERKFDVLSYSIIRLNPKTETKTSLDFNILKNEKYEYVNTSNYKKSVKVILYDVNTYEVVTTICIDDILDDNYPYIIPYVLYSNKYLMIYNLVNSKYVLYDIKSKSRYAYNYSQYKIQNSSTVYIVPFDEQNVFFVEMDKNVILDTVLHIPDTLSSIILQEWEKPNNFTETLQAVLPEPIFYYNNLKKHEKIQYVYMFQNSFAEYIPKNINGYPKYNNSIISFKSMNVIQNLTNEHKSSRISRSSNKSISVVNWVISENNVVKPIKNTTEIVFNNNTDIQVVYRPYFNWIDMYSYWVPDMYVNDYVLMNNISVYTNKLAHRVNRKIFDGATVKPALIAKMNLFNFTTFTQSSEKSIEMNEIISYLSDKNELLDLIPAYCVLENTSSKSYSTYLKSVSNLAYFFMSSVVYDIFFNFRLKYLVPSPQRKLVRELRTLYDTVFHEPMSFVVQIYPYNSLQNNGSNKGTPNQQNISNPSIYPDDYSKIIYYINCMYNVQLNNINYNQLANDFSSIVNSSDLSEYFVTSNRSIISNYKLYVPANSQFPESNNYDTIKIDKMFDNVIDIDSYEQILIQDGYSKIPTSTVFIRDRVKFEEVNV